LADLDKLNHGGIRVIVGAIDLSTALIRYFDNSDLSFEHVVASGSLPPGFPMTEVDRQWYWDGEPFANTPLSPATNFLESCEPDNPAIHRELIVIQLFPMEAPLPQRCLTSSTGWFSSSTQAGSNSTRSSSTRSTGCSNSSSASTPSSRPIARKAQTENIYEQMF